MEWISVDDQLPEKHGSYLCFIWEGEQQVLYWGTYGWQPDTGGALEVTYDMADVVLVSKPTHWMPLPDPPKPEQEG